MLTKRLIVIFVIVVVLGISAMTMIWLFGRGQIAIGSQIATPLADNLKNLLFSTSCEQSCLLGLSPGSPSQHLEEFLKSPNVIYTQQSISLNGDLQEYVVSNPAFILLGSDAWALIWATSNAITNIFLGPTEICPQIVLDTLGIPDYWYQIEGSYEIYFTDLSLIMYVGANTINRVGSFRMMEKTEFQGYIADTKLTAWDESMTSRFSNCQP